MWSRHTRWSTPLAGVFVLASLVAAASQWADSGQVLDAVRPRPDMRFPSVQVEWRHEP